MTSRQGAVAVTSMGPIMPTVEATVSQVAVIEISVPPSITMDSRSQSPVRAAAMYDFQELGLYTNSFAKTMSASRVADMHLPDVLKIKALIVWMPKTKVYEHVLTLLVTGRNFAALPDRLPDSGHAPRAEHRSNRSSDHVHIKRESLSPDLHSSNLNNTGGSRNRDARAERDTQGKNPVIQVFRNLICVSIGSRNRIWSDDEDDYLIKSVRDGYTWSEIAVKMGRSEDSVKGHWYYGNLKSNPRAQGVSYRPLLQRPGPRP